MKEAQVNKVDAMKKQLSDGTSFLYRKGIIFLFINLYFNKLQRCFKCAEIQMVIKILKWNLCNFAYSDNKVGNIK